MSNIKANKMAENIKEKIENKIIDYINSGAEGRLIIFKPENNDLKADLVVERRAKYKESGIQLQINALIIPAQEENFIKDFLEEDFKADKDFYLLFAYFNEIKQQINDNLWLIPSLQFRDMAKAVKLSDGRKVLRFQSSADIKEKNEYAKFIVNIKDLGKLILSTFEKKGGLSFIGQKSETESINKEALKEFISEARKSTYAGDGSPVDNPRLVASKQLEFQKGVYFYRDIYFSGQDRIIGQEIVYQDLKPIWGMNYFGNQIGKTETNFLKEAIFNQAEKCRFGGVSEYKKRELEYHDKGEGDLSDFSGKEEILSQGKSIYSLKYQGGLISDKL